MQSVSLACSRKHAKKRAELGVLALSQNSEYRCNCPFRDEQNHRRPTLIASTSLTPARPKSTCLVHRPVGEKSAKPQSECERARVKDTYQVVVRRLIELGGFTS